MNIEQLKEEGLLLRTGIDIYYFAQHYADKHSYDDLMNTLIKKCVNKTDFNKRICFVYVCFEENFKILISLYAPCIIIYINGMNETIQNIVSVLESQKYTIVVREYNQLEVDKNNEIVQKLFPLVEFSKIQ